MQVIPVIDLMSGIVVHARMGQRDSYRPIETRLSRTPDPVAIAHGLLSLAPFSVLYVADLDAIQKNGSNLAALSELKAAFPALELWIDNGASDDHAVAAARAFGVPVLGSESLRGDAILEANRDALLSLDFRGDEFLGPPEILAHPDGWPERVVAMTLSRVGAGLGPDLERLRKVKSLANARPVFAAGGVRDERDLVALKEAGAAGVLMASALHDGRLPQELLMRVQTTATRAGPVAGWNDPGLRGPEILS